MPGDRTEPTEGCRFCGETLVEFLDLGMSPLCESYRSREQLFAVEPFYPLDLKICPDCLLVQLRAYVQPEEIFSEYAYFSSFSDSWLDHARRFAERMSVELTLGPSHRVVELGSAICGEAAAPRTAFCCATPILGRCIPRNRLVELRLGREIRLCRDLSQLRGFRFSGS